MEHFRSYCTVQYNASLLIPFHYENHKKSPLLQMELEIVTKEEYTESVKAVGKR